MVLMEEKMGLIEIGAAGLAITALAVVARLAQAAGGAAEAIADAAAASGEGEDAAALATMAHLFGKRLPS